MPPCCICVHFIVVSEFIVPVQLNKLSWGGLEATLTGHHAAITSIHVSTEYSIIVSADASGLCIIWDLNKYVTPLNPCTRI